MRSFRTWQQNMITACIIAVLAIAVCGRVALAQAEADIPNEQRLINIDVKDGAIDAVLRMLAKAAGVNIVIGENVTGRVEAVSLRDVTVETALRLITITHGYHWYREGNVYVVTAKPPPGASASAGELRPGIGGPGPERATGPAPSVTPTLEGSVPVQSAEGARAVAPPPVIPHETSTIVTPGAPGEPKIVTKVFPLKYKDAEELAYAFGGTSFGGTTPGAKFPAFRLSDRGHLSGRTPQPYAGPDVFGGGSSTSSRWGQAEGLGGGRSTRGGGSSGRGGTSSRSGRGGGIESFLPGEMEPPVAFMPENALIVQGTQAEIDKFAELVEMLDVPTRQVEIMTKFVDVLSTEASAFGIDWTVATGALEFWNLGFAPGEAMNNVVRYSRGRFQATLAALQNEGRATVINAPHVICPNNQFATISFYTTIPYYTSTTEYNQFGQRIATEIEWEEAEIENTLEVVPRINADDTITIELYPILEDQVGEVIGPNGESMPIIVSQEVMTTVTVADGDTIVMGGLIRKDESYTYQNTPLLSKLPIIGKLFRSKRTRSSNSELLIFVTPKIIREVPPQ